MLSLKERAFALLNTWTTCDTSLVASDLAAEFQEIDRPQVSVVGVDGLNEKLVSFHKVHTGVTIRVIRQVESANIVCTAWLLTCNIRAVDGSDANVLKPIAQPGVSWTYFANGKIIKNRIYRDVNLYLSQRGYHWSDETPPTPPAAKTSPASQALATQKAAQVMVDEMAPPAGAKEMLRQLIQTLSKGGLAFAVFLQKYLADSATGAVNPRYNLKKAEIIAGFHHFFAKASGGTVSMLNCVAEGNSGCCRFLLSLDKLDTKSPQSLKLGSDKAIEGVIWVELGADGMIYLLNLGADTLSPQIAAGRKLVLEKA